MRKTAFIIAALFLLTLSGSADVGESTKTGTPGGNDTEVQFNNNGILDGDAGMTYDAATDDLTVAGNVGADTLTGNGSLIDNVGALTASALTFIGKVNEAAGISIMQAVYISGATGQFPQVSLADNTDTNKEHIVGVAIETKANNQNIVIRVQGEISGLNTAGPTWSDGDPIYVSTAGGLTKTEPTSGAIIHIGHIAYSHASQGKILLLREPRHRIGAPASDDIYIRLGDSAGANKIDIRDYSNAAVASINSDGDIGAVDCSLSGVLNVPNMKTGVDQATAGAAAGELWAESDAGFVVKLGQ